MKKLNILDLTWLMLDNADQKMNISFVFMFQKPTNYSDHYITDLVQDIRAHPWPLPHYNEKPYRSLLTLGRYVWKRDLINVDMRHHVKLVQIPGNRSINDLRKFIVNEQAKPFDYSRPLWEICVVDGLEDKKQFAIIYKAHHCSIDGISLVNLLTELFKINPSDQSNPDMISKINGQRHKHRKTNKLGRWNWIKGYLKGLNTVLKNIKSGETMLIPPKGAVPTTRFNAVVNTKRSFATVEIPLSEVKELCGIADCTINDMLSAFIGTALSRYLNEKGEPQDKSLYAAMPVSIHTDDDMDESNKLATSCYPLASHIENAQEKIALIKAATTKGKMEIKLLPKEVIYSLIGVGLIPIIIKKISGVRSVNPTRMTNVMISNVPFFKETRYYKGSKLLS